MGLEGLTDQELLFLKFVEFSCAENDITLLLSETVSVSPGGVDSNGYFSGFTKTLAVATLKPKEEWFLILIHEFCHLLQYLENTPEWSKFSDTPAPDIFFEWLDFKRELDLDELNQVTQVLIDLEVDCEQRVLNLIKQFSLNIDLKRYAQNANSYVLFYHVIKKTRKWYEIGKEPYNNKSIVGAMPKHMDFNYRALNKELETAVENILKSYI